MMRQAGVQLTLNNEQNPLSQEMNTPIDSDVNSRRLPNLPPLDLLTGPRDDYLKFCLPLYEASIRCDWPVAKAILEKRPELVAYGITKNGETALHVASSAKASKQVRVAFVKNLVVLMKEKELALENKNFNTALFLAAPLVNLKTVRITVEKNRELVKIPGDGGKMLPLYAAAASGNFNVAKYLYEQSNLGDDGWTYENRGLLLDKCVENYMFDMALQIVKKYPELGRRGSVLENLAQKPDAFAQRKPNIHDGYGTASYNRPTKRHWLRKLSRVDVLFGRGTNLMVDYLKLKAPQEGQALQLLRLILDDIVKLSENEIDGIFRGPNANDTHSSEALFIAAEMGNTIFVVEVIRRFPDLIWKVNDSNHTIFHIAVENRHAGIYSMLHEIGYMRDSITSLEDENGNNMLHLVAKIAKKKKLEEVSGVIFQMQHELVWFREVESMINPSGKKRKNKDGLTPNELFTKEHEDLLAQSVKWVKGTANQCVIVATLVATMAFAAAITVPGGYDQTTGIPIFYQEGDYTAFVLIDALSLLASSISILSFITILTSRFSERDFLESIPEKFQVFLSTLFISVITMIGSFSLSFSVIYQKEMTWIANLILWMTVFPVAIYIMLQISILKDIFRKTFAFKYLFNNRKHVFYYRNPVL